MNPTKNRRKSVRAAAKETNKCTRPLLANTAPDLTTLEGFLGPAKGGGEGGVKGISGEMAPHSESVATTKT